MSQGSLHRHTKNLKAVCQTGRSSRFELPSTLTLRLVSFKWRARRPQQMFASLLHPLTSGCFLLLPAATLTSLLMVDMFSLSSLSVPVPPLLLSLFPWIALSPPPPCLKHGHTHPCAGKNPPHSPAAQVHVLEPSCDVVYLFRKKNSYF